MAKTVLASGSKTRAALLRNAGIDVEVQPASIDEPSLQASLVSDGASPRDIADTLAEYKARQVSLGSDALIIGCDQTLALGENLVVKSSSYETAFTQLKKLEGQTHSLFSSVVIYENHRPVWRITREAKLTMRSLMDDQIQDYLQNASSDVLESVGVYHLEGIGAQLFTSIIGDYFTILGLPLLDVLGFLRTRGVGI